MAVREEDGHYYDEKGFEKFARELMKTDLAHKEEIIFDNRMLYAMKSNNWAECIRLGNEYMLTDGSQDFKIYNWGLRANVDCKDSLQREQIARWMDIQALACRRNPKMVPLIRFFEDLAGKLRHPERNAKDYCPTVILKGKVNALREGEDMIRVIKKEGFFKQVVDSCPIAEDGTYRLEMKVKEPGAYILDCQGGQQTKVWLGDEEVSVDFLGFLVRALPQRNSRPERGIYEISRSGSRNIECFYRQR